MMTNTSKTAPATKAAHATRTALVTGASSGIGRYLADNFARNGINLVVAARGAAALEDLKTAWESHGVQVTTVANDLSRPGAAQELANELERRGIEIDFLVNNAGVGHFGLFAESPLDAELAMMRLNMDSLIVLTKRLLPGIQARSGKILNVASTAAFQPGPYMAVYYATKAFVLSFSEALAEELAGTGVTVTALCPGPTASGFQDKAVMHDSALVKNKRLPSAESVANAGYRAMMAGRRVYIPGLLNWLMAQSVRVSPRRVVTLLVKWLSRPVQPVAVRGEPS